MSLLAEFVKQAALDEGFALAGIAPVAPLGELDSFPAWIAHGFHGEMEYLAARNDAGELRRASIANVAPWARSVVVCAANYNSDTPYSTACDDPAKGWISRYAFVHTDYHKLLLARLRRIEQRMAERIVEQHPAAAQPSRVPGAMWTPARWWNACWRRIPALDGRARTVASSISSLVRGCFSELFSPRTRCRPICPPPTAVAVAPAASMPVPPRL